MHIDLVRIQKFRSFMELKEFNFPVGHGLYFMTGDNRAEPRLGANGAGKSTVWDAIVWCLYGKTTKGLRASDIANWDIGKEARVEVKFTHEGSQYSVTRSWSPNKWFLVDDDGVITELTDDVTNPLKALLGIEFNPFLNCILMAQGQPDMFLDLRPEAKASLFSEVMGLDRWLAYSEIASKKATELEEAAKVLKNKISDLEGQMVAWEKIDFSIKITAWEQQRTLHIEEFQQASDKAMDKRDALEERFEGLDLPGLAKKVQSLRDKMAESAVRIKAYKSTLAFFEEADECPTCKQPLDHRAIADQIKQLTKLLDQEKKDFDSINEEWKVKDAMLQDLRFDERKLENLDKELQRIKIEANKLREERNPYKDEQARFDKELDRVDDALYRHKEELDILNERILMNRFWVREFKDIRLELIAEALTQLEVEVNSAVIKLGLEDWQLFFEVDRETKSGSIQRGFSVKVLSPHNDRAVPWEAWSGGEAQRLRIATNMGLSDLIRAHKGVTVDIEVYDEPTQYLSPQGVDDLLEALSARAIDENRQIWLVDHRSLAHGCFDGVCSVIKTETGSHFEWVK